MATPEGISAQDSSTGISDELLDGVAGGERGHYTVVVNKEGQYSLWPTQREFPPGWSAGGFSGDRYDCLQYIERTWTDMRPLSLINALNRR